VKKIAVLITLAFLGVFGVGAGEAEATLSYDLTYVINGSAIPNGSNWISAAFTTNAPGSVRFTLTSNLTAPAQSSYYVGEVGINVDPTVVPSTLGFNVTGTSGSFTNPTISKGIQDAQTVPGGGVGSTGFDILFTFANPFAGRFNLGDSITYNITGQGITEDSFRFMNSQYEANVGAHLMLGGGISGAISNSNVPIPAAVWLLGSGLIGVAVIRRRRI
jgi:hypothetical protein